MSSESLSYREQLVQELSGELARYEKFWGCVIPHQDPPYCYPYARHQTHVPECKHVKRVEFILDYLRDEKHHDFGEGGHCLI